MVDLAKELLRRYRPAQADDVMHTGQAYAGVCSETVAIFEILQTAVEEVGAENFDGQAFYDAAVKYETSGRLWEGYLKSGFSGTKRYLLDHYLIYEWDAEREDLVRVGDWQSLVAE